MAKFEVGKVYYGDKWRRKDGTIVYTSLYLCTNISGKKDMFAPKYGSFREVSEDNRRYIYDKSARRYRIHEWGDECVTVGGRSRGYSRIDLKASNVYTGKWVDSKKSKPKSPIDEINKAFSESQKDLRRL